LSVQLKLAGALIGRDDDKAQAIVDGLNAQAIDALENLRDLARGIYPPLLADQGLGAALRAQASRSPVQVVVEADGLGRYPQAVEAAVYFCALEALQNIAKYARAEQATVTVAQRDGWLQFTVRDDGVGFEAAAGGHGTGVQGMSDRLAALGGELVVRSSPGAGTAVEGRLPIDGL